jgi:hypothetical protein
MAVAAAKLEMSHAAVFYANRSDKWKITFSILNVLLRP